MRESMLFNAIAAIGFIASHAIRNILGKSPFDTCLNQLHLMRRSAFNLSGNIFVHSVIDCHDLGAFIALCLSDSNTSFFSNTKVSFISASKIAIPPPSSRFSIIFLAIRLNRHNLTNCRNRLLPIFYGGYRAAIFF